MEEQPPPPSLPDAPDKEKMEQIRRRRMEKLAGPASSSSRKSPAPSSEVPPASSSPKPAATMDNSSSTSSTAKPNVNIKPASATPPSSSENPFVKLGGQASSTTPSAVRPDPAGVLGKRTRAELDLQTPSSAPARKPTPAAEEPIEVYESRILSQIFRITLDPEQKTDSSNHKLIYLPDLRKELEEDGGEVRLTAGNLDAAILEAAATIPHNKPVFDYLLPCWKRVTKALKARRGYAGQKDAILKEAKRLCMSNCIFAAEMPDIFRREPNPTTDFLTPYFLFEPGEDKGICPDFLEEAVSRFPEDDMAKSMITKAFAGLSSQLSNMTMNDVYKPYVHAFKLLTQFTPIVVAIAEDPLFQMAVSANNIEKYTLLGPFFRISPLQPEVTKEYFNAPKTMDKRHIATSQDALRLTLQTHQKDLLDIINHFVRAGPVARNKTLDWFAYIVNQNHKRRAIQVDPKEVSTDGFMLNVTVVLDGLCEPFMDTTFSKISKIDVDYLRREPRLDIKDETKLNADQKASDAYYAVKVDGTSNFISEVFFLTLAAHHYGTEALNTNLKSLDKDIKNMQKSMAAFEAERPKFANDPRASAMMELRIKRFNEALEKAMSLKMGIEGVLSDKLMQAKSLLFMRYVTVWLLRIATQTDYTPDKTIKLPLPSTPPEAFDYLPEYILEDIIGNFTFVMRYISDVIISAVGDEIVALCITFLTNSEYIKNPYLKAKLVTLLFAGTWPVYHRTKGVLGDVLMGSAFANDHLLHALMKFYIECEQTGAHTQFYDKFNIRYEIFQVIKCVWPNQIYRERLMQESKTNTEFFLRFVNLLLNDATYVLDEALTKFPKIHDLQTELRRSPDEGQPMTAEEREAKEEELRTAENQAQSYMQLTNETLAMMKLFSATLSGSFTMPEIVDRVAAMLNYTLDIISGKKSLNLKVENLEKYQFRPRTFLSEFVEIYLNLGVSERFVEAVARDGRSYKPENFESAARILKRYGLKSPEDLQAWEVLIQRFKAAKEIEDQADEDMGEIPDDYIDPILATLMLDPVMLPISKQIVDRSTIRSHLLSDPHDPFNRTPLKIEDVIPMPDLQAQILAWKDDIRAKAKLARENALAEAMDTTAG
ncbi:Ubiquitin conjugation factor E4 protein [Rutstroemia sp. NJR-2017a WRK4]|nr:Ubiquitin conjugation factor E4 protein [Rutstroemia sp. NJR-2017a WRK4]